MSKLKVFFKTSLNPIALCLTLVAAAPVFAEKGHQHKHDGMHKILSKLSLNETQKQDIKQIFQENKQDRNGFRADASILKKEIRSLVQTSEWNQAAIENALTLRQTLDNKNAFQRATNRNQLWNLLNQEQQVELITQLEIRQTHYKETRPGNKKRSKRKGKILKRLDLTEQQATAVKGIKSATRGSAENTKTNIKNYKQAERALVQSIDFNPEAWQTLYAQYQSDFLTMAVIKTKTKHNVWNLLTVEQQNKAQKIGKNRKGKPGKKSHI
jgi:protein CpxP